MSDERARIRRRNILIALLLVGGGMAIAGWIRDSRENRAEIKERRAEILELKGVIRLSVEDQERLHREVPDVPDTVTITRVVRGRVDYGPGVTCKSDGQDTRCTSTLPPLDEILPPAPVDCPELDWPATVHTARQGWYRRPVAEQLAGTCQYEEMTDGARAYGRIKWLGSVVVFDQDGEGVEVARGPEYVRDVDLALTAKPDLQPWPRLSLRAMVTTLPGLRLGATYFPWPRGRFLRHVGFVAEGDWISSPESVYQPSYESYASGSAFEAAGGLEIRW